MVMIFAGVIQLFLWELIIPVVIGAAVPSEEKGAARLCFSFCAGQIVLWAVFQPLAVAFILMNKTFSPLVCVYAGVVCALLIAAVFLGVRNGAYRLNRIRAVREKEKDRLTIILWMLVFILLLLQLFMDVFLAYADGDDAFYIATSTITNNADTMYMKLPYTGGSTELDVRHGLAPFPIWIAFLARISGVHTAIVAHSAVSAVLIIMSYSVLYLLGSSMLKKKQLPIFMLIAELLILFGDYSYYTVENFMLARSRQGKAAIGSIIIPFVIYFVYKLLEKLRMNEKLRIWEWAPLFATVVAGCLCTTMGALLLCLLLGIVGVLGAIMYKRFCFLVAMIICCVPGVIVAGMYVLLA